MLKDVIMWAIVLVILLIGFAFALASAFPIEFNQGKVGSCLIDLFWSIFLMTVLEIITLFLLQ